EVDGLAQDGDRLRVPLGAPVEEPELEAGVDRARGGGEDALELAPRLGVLAALHERSRGEIARAHVSELEGEGALEPGDRLVPLLLLVVDGAELRPPPRIARIALREGTDLGLRLVQPAEPEQQVAEALDERRVVRVRER